LRSGGALQGALVAAQFAISIALIAITIVMAMQMRFARQADLGFQEEGVLVVRVPEGEGREALARSFEAAVARLPGVMSVALSSAVPSDQSEDNISIGVLGEAKPVQIGFHRVDGDFFRTYQVRLLSGRVPPTVLASGASPADHVATPAVVNVSALKRLGLGKADGAVGRVVRSGSRAFVIQGVVPDLHFRSLHKAVRDELYALDDAPGGAVSIRFDTDDVPGLLSSIDRLWAERAQGQTIERTLLDDALSQLYEREERQASLLGIFSSVAIVLSCLGLLAMAAFSVQRRTREIAVRKVLGASTPDILKLLLWQFSKPVLLANLVAWPVAWFASRRWLDGFAYRIDMPVTAFAAASFAALLIAFSAVAAHALKVARTSPAVALRHD
jgi:putative ABC transport system permease protein